MDGGKETGREIRKEGGKKRKERESSEKQRFQVPF